MGPLLGDQSIDSKLCKDIWEQFRLIAKSINRSGLTGEFKRRSKANKLSHLLYDQPYNK